MGLLDVSNEISEELEAGLSREEVFKKHVQANPKGAMQYAYCIASIPTPALRKKYLTLNALLSLLLVVYAVLNVLAELPINPNEPTIFIVIKTLVPLVFAYFTFRFHGGVYRLFGVWFLYDLFESILLTEISTVTVALRLFILFFVVVLSFYLARKAFPSLKLLGPKQDSNGNFFL